MAETLLKSVRIRERWGDINLYDENGSPKYKWIGRGFDIKISVFKSGNKKRIVRSFDVGGSERGSGDPQEGDRYSSKTLKWLNPIEYKEGDTLDWTFGEYGDNAFIYQYITTQAAILKREKYYDGTTFKPSPYTDSGQPDISLADWVSLRTSNSNNVVKLNSPDYFGQSLNESDKIYRKKFGYNPPYYEIIQDPFIDPQDELGKNKLLFRNFGLDRYYLNNGSEILIEWKKDGSTIGGTDYSDNWQRELDIYDIEKSEDSNIEITKSATIYGPPTNNSGYNDAERFCLSSEITEVYDGYGFDDENKVRNDVGFIMLKEIDGVKYESKVWNAKRSANVSRKLYGGGIYDEEILNEIIEKWQQSYGNTKLKLNDNALTPTTPTLEFKLPVLLNSQIDPGGTPSQIGGTPSQIDPVGGTPSTTGLSQSILLNVVFPEEFEVKVREDVPKFKIWVGDPQPEEQVDGFITEDFEQTDEEGNVVELSNEYIENEFAGDGEDIITAEEFKIEMAAAQEDSKKAGIVAPIGATIPIGDIKGVPTNTPTPSKSVIPPAFNNTPIYSQYDPRWGSTPFDYAPKGIKCGDNSTVASSGCGPSAVSMVINFWASKGHCKPVTPAIVAKFFADFGGRVCGSGSGLGSVPKDKFKETFGIILNSNATADQIMSALKKEYPCVMSGKGYTGYNFKGEILSNKYTKGHFVCLTGIDSEGRIRVNDSGNNPSGGKAITAFLPGKTVSNSSSSVSQRAILYPASMSNPVA
jgi:hypothetical protein